MPRPIKYGLRVAFVELAVRVRERSGRPQVATGSGWYIHTHEVTRWVALMDLRFMRQKDALRAAQALTAAGLNCHSALLRADPMEVKRIATECLQW